LNIQYFPSHNFVLWGGKKKLVENSNISENNTIISVEAARVLWYFSLNQCVSNNNNNNNNNNNYYYYYFTLPLLM
jgi:hypothetical protein